ncbi:putative transcription factor MADS-type1 family [Arabidopsis thaliana]|uniref:Transcription factor MADS-box superfamily n=2 Tax=Arabidopsis TaxID=3701 RepID=A0A8T2EKT6_9BRAS|nr:Transcription factor MADS-box superfamily [Arabidopsis thaliana x Arabidopsis arenosa]OAP03795.1 AGL57 [Arabidopsis thaliana]CAD5322020.1 unnamed protein product [Arabidopsis thaliana]VYS56242.1 unnamed protein product [Arabidopsis thaliana]
MSSTKQAKGRKTKGKQKIEMKKVENYGDRMITFSKRKTGIFKKMNELVAMCDVEVAFLIFSQPKKPYTFAHPSMKEVADRLKNPSRQEPLERDDTRPLVEAYKKRRLHDLVKKMEALEEELAMDLEKLKLLKESRNEKKLDKMWWNFPSEGLSAKELQQRYQAMLELRDNLCDNMAHLRLGKDCGGSSSVRVGRRVSGGVRLFDREA